MSDPIDNGNILHEVDVENSVHEDLKRPGNVWYENEEVIPVASTVTLNASYVKAELEAIFADHAEAINGILLILQNNGIMEE